MSPVLSVITIVIINKGVISKVIISIVIVFFQIFLFPFISVKHFNILQIDIRFVSYLKIGMKHPFKTSVFSLFYVFSCLYG